MKVLLIMPNAYMHKLIIGSHKRSFREAPLTMAILAALIDDPQIEIKIIDENVDDIPYNYSADLVGISAITGTAKRAYRIAEYFRNKGIKVVLGGVHVSIMPEEASLHADAIVIGMAERSWPRLIDDFKKGKMKKVYEDRESNENECLQGVPAPRLDLMRKNGYMASNTVQATRGCNHTCDFCTVPVVWPKYYKRPVADVIRDIKNIPGKYIAFNDVSLIEDKDYAKELFSAMIPLKKKWGGLVTTLVERDEELLELIHKSGCVYLLLGFESANQGILKSIYKGFNKEKGYEELVDCLHRYGISVQGCFVFGFDEDGHDVFEKTVQRIIDLKIDIPRYSIYTPYPGTPLFDRLEKEGRIISRNWNDYDTMHVVYQPRLLTPDELYDGFKWAYKETFKLSHIAKRTIFRGLGPVSIINFIGNLAYRIFVTRLYGEERFKKPFGVKNLPI